VFLKGNHGLLESETGYNSEIPKLKRFVPGLFEMMSIWLKKRTSARSSTVLGSEQLVGRKRRERISQLDS
jgi:hypothetical protein